MQDTASSSALDLAFLIPFAAQMVALHHLHQQRLLQQQQQAAAAKRAAFPDGGYYHGSHGMADYHTEDQVNVEEFDV